MSAELPAAPGDAPHSHHHHHHGHAPAVLRTQSGAASPFDWSATQRLALVAALIVLLWAAILAVMA